MSRPSLRCKLSVTELRDSTGIELEMRMSCQEPQSRHAERMRFSSCFELSVTMGMYVTGVRITSSQTRASRDSVIDIVRDFVAFVLFKSRSRHLCCRKFVPFHVIPRRAFGIKRLIAETVVAGFLLREMYYRCYKTWSLLCLSPSLSSPLSLSPSHSLTHSCAYFLYQPSSVGSFAIYTAKPLTANCSLSVTQQKLRAVHGPHQ